MTENPGTTPPRDDEPQPSQGQPPAGPPPAPQQPYGQQPPPGQPYPPQQPYPQPGYAQQPSGAPYGAPTAGTSVGDAFSWGWTKFTQQVGPFLLGVLAYLAVIVVVSAVLFAVILGGTVASVDPDTPRSCATARASAWCSATCWWPRSPSCCPPSCRPG
ncbi:hypothetical protein [Cellulomonas sp. Y8]|uniref:hypothetical protein n=1 Tax=Cellulomonas sp. Y8 TaxID=2591145 RepID=UPI0011CA16E0|nr:hypothetical protein [Cellulomonas sp. Y8]